MNILVLNGSPAGKDSITLQTVEYLKLFRPEHCWEVLHVGQRIRGFEKDFTEAREAFRRADLVLFCYPVYTFLAPAQLHRFLELIRENGCDLSGKYATQLTTSKHFYDTTAHRFIEDRCADLGLRYIRGLSADMEDLLSEKGREEAKAFFRYVLWNMERGYCEKPSAARADGFVPVTATVPESGAAAAPGGGQGEETAAGGQADDLRVALVTDYDPAQPLATLLSMIRRFQAQLPGSCELVNLREFPFDGGCLGCFSCAASGRCIYKDGFDDYLRTHINSADAVVYAYTIRDHSMGTRFKLYDDRQFCNGHRTVTMGKPVAYLVDGPLSVEENLRILMEARAQVGGNFLAGVVSDETDPDAEIDRMLQTLVYAVRSRYVPPKDFYGVGGLKIFRDLIYQMQGLMKEDHRFYKAHGFYDDLPQKRPGRILGMYLVSALMSSETLRKKSGISLTDGIMMPYRKVLEQAKKEARSSAGGPSSSDD